MGSGPSDLGRCLPLGSVWQLRGPDIGLVAADLGETMRESSLGLSGTSKMCVHGTSRDAVREWHPDSVRLAALMHIIREISCLQETGYLHYLVICIPSRFIDIFYEAGNSSDRHLANAIMYV